MTEVVKDKPQPTTDSHVPKGAWAKKAPSPMIKAKEAVACYPSSVQTNQIPAQLVPASPEKAQGKWKLRIEQKNSQTHIDNLNSPSHIIQPKTVENSAQMAFTELNDHLVFDKSNKVEEPRMIQVKDQLIQTSTTIHGGEPRPVHVSNQAEIKQIQKPSDGQAAESRPPKNKWLKQGVPNDSTRTQQTPYQIPSQNKYQLPSKGLSKGDIVVKAFEKGVEKGGNAKQILKAATKKLETEDPELAQKAQEFFFEKIGAALLNNFKNNLVPCGCCGRKFDSSTLAIIIDALKKHEPICARSNPLPKKKF